MEHRRKKDLDFIFTGIHELDTALGYLQAPNFMVIGANTGAGKTSLMIQLMVNMCRRGRKCLYLTSEMGKIDLLEKILACMSRTDSLRFKTDAKNLDMATVWSKVYEREHHFVLAQMTRFSLGEINRQIREYKPEVVFVDFIQRFSVSARENRAAAFSNIANALKDIAMQHNITVIAGSQLHRPEKGAGAGRAPAMSDLKESGGIEEAADKVLLLNHIENAGVDGGCLVNAILAKNRQGSTGSIPLTWEKKFSRFHYPTEEICRALNQ
jgi:replicative DNA helicase